VELKINECESDSAPDGPISLADEMKMKMKTKTPERSRMTMLGISSRQRENKEGRESQFVILNSTG
jgi:hypothetical protein